MKDLNQNNLQDASFQVKDKNKRKQFIQQIQKCIQFKKLFQPKCQKKQNEPQKIKNLAIEKIKQVFKKYEIQQSQQLIDQLLMGQFDSTLAEVKNSLRKTLKQELQKCQALQNYFKSVQKTQINIDYEQNARQAVLKIFKKYKSIQENQLEEYLNLILKNQIQKVIQNLKKSQRDNFRKQISQCKQLIQYQKSSIQLQQDYFQESNKALKQILKSYDLQDQQINECLQFIYKQDAQRVKSFVKKAQREKFWNQIISCEKFKLYKQKNIPVSQTQQLKNNASKSVKIILKKYLDQVEQIQICLNLAFQNNVAGIQDYLKPNKRGLVKQQLQKCQQLQTYMKKTNNHLNKILLKTLEKIKNFNAEDIGLICEELINGKYNKLQQVLNQQQFYKTLSLLYNDEDYLSFLQKNEQKIQIEKLYLYYKFVTLKNTSIYKFEQILTIIENSFNKKGITIEDENIWLKKFIDKNKNQKIKIILKEIYELQKILQFNPSNKNLIELKTIIYSLLKKNIIISIKQNEQAIKQLLQLSKVSISEVKQKVISLKDKIQKSKDKFTIEQYNRDLRRLERLSQLIDQKTHYFKILQIKDLIEIFKNDNQMLLKKNISFQNLQSMIGPIKQSILKLINQKVNNYQQYLSQKSLLLTYQNYLKFLELNKQLVNSMYIDIEYENKCQKILFYEQTKAENVLQICSKQFNLKINEIILQLQIQNRRYILSPQALIKIKPNKFYCYKKSIINTMFKNNIIKMQLSKEINIQSLKSMICIELQKQNIQIQLDKITLIGSFIDSDNTIDIQLNETISNMQLKVIKNLKLIKINYKLTIDVFYQAQTYTFLLQSVKTIIDLKKLIFNQTNIPINSQSITFQNQNKYQEVFHQKFQQLEPNKTTITFKLISKASLEHYGFHQNYEQKFQDYNQFFIEKSQDLQDMIDSCSLNKQQQKNFFDQLIRFLYAQVKRRFSLMHIATIVKQKFIQKNSMVIWSGGDFTQQFLIQYILYNADKKLRVELMNILRTYAPLPIFFKQFKNINDIKEQWSINEQIQWLLHPGLYVTSMGLHNSNQQKGKSSLNNLLYFTKFQRYQSKHPILYGCPQISIRLLENYQPLNFIDIPSETSETNVDKLLKITHVLIIHSWKKHEQNLKYINDIKQKYKIKYVLCIQRDSKDRQQTITKVKNFKYQQSPFIQIHNIKQDIQKKNSPPFIKNLRDKIFDINLIALKDLSYLQSKKIFNLFDSKLLIELQKIFEKVKIKFDQLKIVFNNYETIKNLQIGRDQRDNQKIQQIKRKTIRNGLSQQIRQILMYIDKNNDLTQILMFRLRQLIKQYRCQFQKPYNIINEYKNKISNNFFQNHQELLNLAQQGFTQISKLKKMRKISKKQTKKQIDQELSQIYLYYQNQIKPSFFSIQSLWRQIQYLTNLSNEVKIQNRYLIDLYVQLKRKQIWNSQAFELLDGDLLQMPKNIIQKVFEGIFYRVAVITILGPQSSGKSTLLNFLFGCDFGTSAGRCTKGVYGTFFKFSNLNIPNCDGIFLIDTEGLFAVVNKKDQTRRKDFDSKLVLFCLAVSDFVLVNTKGNIDNQSKKIFKSSLERLQALAQQNLQKPEIYLILNQNNNSQIMTSAADIIKLREMFSLKNTRSLSSAYNLTTLNKNHVKLLSQKQNVVRKQPRHQFLNQTDELQRNMIDIIESKSKNYKSISIKIDQMEKMWTTIDSFPNLGKSISKKMQQTQKSINQWKISKIQQLTIERRKLFQQLKQNILQQKQIQQKILLSINQALVNFKQKFYSQKLLDELTDEQKMKVQLEETKVKLAFETIKNQLNNQIKDLQKSKLTQKIKTQGCQYQRQAIRKVKKIQKQQNRQLTNEQKIYYFNIAFNKSLEKLKSVAAPQEHSSSCFLRIFQFYQSAKSFSNVSSTNKTDFKNTNNNPGLPKAQWKCSLTQNFQEYSRVIKEKIFKHIGDDSNRYIQHIKNKHTKILNQDSRTDATLEYFNMRTYFRKKKVSFYYEISQYNFIKCLKFDLLKAKIAQQYSKITKTKSSLIDKSIQKIFDKLNNLFKIFNFQMNDLKNFKEILQYKLKWVKNIFNQPRFSIEYITQNKQKIKSKQNSNNSYYGNYGSNNSNGYTSNYGQKNTQYGWNNSNGYTSNYGQKNTQYGWNNSHGYTSNYGQKNTQYGCNNSHGYTSNYGYNYYNGYTSKDLQKNVYYGSNNYNGYTYNNSVKQSHKKNQIENEQEQCNQKHKKSNFSLEQNQIKEISKIVDYQSFINKMKLNSHTGQSSSKKQFIHNNLMNHIKWSKIKQIISQTSQYKNIIQHINQQIKQIISADLSKFGIVLQCKNFYNYIMQPYQRQRIQYKISNNQNIKMCDKQNEFIKQLKKFDYFDQNLIRNYWRKSDVKRKNFIKIGGFYEQIFQVLPEYSNNKELQTYISDQSRQVFCMLQSDTMKQFVYKQLKNQKKFQLLFQNINSIIFKSSQFITLQNVTGIYVDVAKQISKFNNDLNQVSHKLTLLFSGYIHLYTVYLFWKKLSQLSIQEANKPFYQLQKEKDNHLQFFLKQTSNNDQTIAQGQCDRFLAQVMECCKNIIKDHKEKININQNDNFKKINKRQVVQHKIDLQCFDVSSKSQKWIKYLQHPATVIQEKYEQLIKLSLSKIKYQYTICPMIDELITEFKTIIMQLLQKLKLQKIKPDIDPLEMFSIEKKTQKQVSLIDKDLQVVHELLMKYFLDLLTQQQRQVYQSKSFKLILDNKYKFIKSFKEPTPLFQTAIKKIAEKKLSMSKLYIFIEKLADKIFKRQQINGLIVQKFSFNIKKNLQINQQNQKHFRSLVTVKICNQLCPGCQRICGVQGPHTNGHQCLYGHQMRGLGGVKLQNDQASVIRCQDLDITSLIKFNGNPMSWKQFKIFWQTRTEGYWSFNDLASKKNQQLFRNAWNLAGKYFCQKYSMKFVQSNKVNQQKSRTATTGGPIHYIFVLDDSGSMSGKKWQDLKIAFKTTIDTIKTIPSAQQTVKVSVLLEGSTCLINQENTTPNGVNLNINPRFGGNNFRDTFGKVFTLSNKYISTSQIKYVFMTDGGCSYPSNQVAQLKQMKNSYPGKFEYFGIQFQTNGDTMKLIQKQLDGKNTITHNVAQLTQAFVEVITRQVKK